MTKEKQNNKLFNKNEKHLEEILENLGVDRDLLVSAIIIKDRLILEFTDGHIATFRVSQGVGRV